MTLVFLPFLHRVKALILYYKRTFLVMRISRFSGRRNTSPDVLVCFTV